MKTRITLVPVVALATAFMFQSCLRDTCVRESTFMEYTPIYMSYDDLRAAVASEPAQAIHKPGKIYFIGSTVLINEFDRGIHVIDNADPSNPQNVAFINIPGNVDLAVRNNTLYADSYVDLVAIDISNPNSVVEVGRVQNVFPHRTYNNGFTGDPALGVINDWDAELVTVETSCTNHNGSWWVMEDVLMFGDVANTSGGPSATGFNGSGGGNRETPGMGGSMARFALVDAYLYTVDNSNMHVFNISDLHNPVESDEVNIGMDIETLWNSGLSLFVGSQSGMHIYDITVPGAPEFLSTFAHVTSCDPVVVDGNHAFVTLRSGTPCAGWTNQLDVVNISDLHNPWLETTYPMFNPHGLGVDGDLIFICDGDEGLKVYDKGDLGNITSNILATYPTINAFDVIPTGTVAMMIGTDGFYQYDYTDINNIVLLSVIPVEAI